MNKTSVRCCKSFSTFALVWLFCNSALLYGQTSAEVYDPVTKTWSAVVVQKCSALKKSFQSRCLEDEAAGKEYVARAKLEKEKQLSAFVADAKLELTRDFKDPSFAKWRRLFVVPADGRFMFLCGEVNGKNSYGAYVGFKRFYVNPNAKDETGMAVTDETETQVANSLFNTLHSVYCMARVENLPILE